MSDLYLTGSESKGFPVKGDSDYLTPQETAFVQRILRRAEVFPQEFWKAIMQKVALDGEPVPRSQIQGLASFDVFAAERVGTSEATTSTSYTDLSTAGPLLAGLRNGLYIVTFGMKAIDIASGDSARMSLQINSTAAVDVDCVQIKNSGTGNIDVSTSRALIPVTLIEDNNNTIVSKYRSETGSSVAFEQRWLFAIRYGNA